MLQIFVDTFEMLVQLIEQEDEVEMPPLGQMGLMMVDWLDPQKVV
jgi:condensin complex subunit 3